MTGSQIPQSRSLQIIPQAQDAAGGFLVRQAAVIIHNGRQRFQAAGLGIVCLLYTSSIKSLNSFEAIASTAAEGCFQGYDPFRFPEVYDSITQQDLLDFIRDNIRPERMALSIIYPKE